MTGPIVPLIMCGGAGTRLWPASREGRPKQFLPLFGPYSTFQDAVRRVSDPALFGRPIVVTNVQYRFLVAEQLAAIGAEADILQASDLPERLRDALDPVQVHLASGELSIKRTTAAIEQILIRRALQKTKGNRTRAAQLLEISHRALLYKIKDYKVTDL